MPVDECHFCCEIFQWLLSDHDIKSSRNSGNGGRGFVFSNHRNTVAIEINIFPPKPRVASENVISIFFFFSWRIITISERKYYSFPAFTVLSTVILLGLAQYLSNEDTISSVRVRNVRVYYRRSSSSSNGKVFVVYMEPRPTRAKLNLFF